jgi:hypothetical protein
MNKHELQRQFELFKGENIIIECEGILYEIDSIEVATGGVKINIFEKAITLKEFMKPSPDSMAEFLLGTCHDDIPF